MPSIAIKPRLYAKRGIPKAGSHHCMPRHTQLSKAQCTKQGTASRDQMSEVKLWHHASARDNCFVDPHFLNIFMEELQYQSMQ